MLKAIPLHHSMWRYADLDSGLRRNDPVSKEDNGVRGFPCPKKQKGPA